MNDKPVIVWLRRDLRIADNPALHAARQSGAPVLPVFILDESEAFAPGAAARWWLHHSLASLSERLEAAGAPLVLRRGDSAKMLLELARETKAGAVYWNRRYAPAHVATDKALKGELKEQGVDARSFNAAFLREPWELQTKTGGPYRVFTPFWKALRAAGPARGRVLPAMKKIAGASGYPHSDSLDEWKLTPTRPDWAAGFNEHWRPGEPGAQAALDDFLDEPAHRYAADRERPDVAGTSRLSPHLAFGEIAPLQIWTAVQQRIAAGDLASSQGEKFLSEIAWREFSYNLLFHNPGLEKEPLRKEFAAFPWRDDKAGLAAWRRGLTGYPIVDAGMRQLWSTGWMHNRVRMIVASFLVKDLLVHWRKGEAWFWDTLVDADPANNPASWQWVAGCGADAAPYFRVFNPVTQGEKFDPEGAYIRAFAPELKDLDARYIHKPWEAPAETLKESGVRLGGTYPEPIVDHAAARKRALAAYDEIRKGALENA